MSSKITFLRGAVPHATDEDCRAMLAAKGGDVDLALSSLLAMDEFKTVPPTKVAKSKQPAAQPARDSRQSSDRPPRRDGTPAGRGGGRGGGNGGRGGSDRPASGRGGGAGRGAKSVPTKPIVVSKDENHPDAFHADQNVVSEIGASTNGAVASGGDWGDATPAPAPGWGKTGKTMAEIIKAKQAPPPAPVAPVPPPAKSSYRRPQHADAPIDPPFDLQPVAQSAIEPATAPQAYSNWSNDAAKNLLNSLTKGSQAAATDGALSASDNTVTPPTAHYAPVLGKTTAQEFEAQQLANTFAGSFVLGAGASDPFASATTYEAPSTTTAGTYGSYITSQAPPAQPQPQSAVNAFASSAFPGSVPFATTFAGGFSGPTDVSSQPGYDAAQQAFTNYGTDQLKQQAAYTSAIPGYGMQYQPVAASVPAATTKPAYGQAYPQPAQSTASAPDPATAASSSQSVQQNLPAGLPAPVYPNQAVAGMPPGTSGYNTAIYNPYNQPFNPANPYVMQQQFQNMYSQMYQPYQGGYQNPANAYSNAQYQMTQQPHQQPAQQGANQQSNPNANASRPAPGYNTAAYGAQQGSNPAQNQAQQLNYSNVSQYGMTGYEDMSAYGGKQEKQDAYGSQGGYQQQQQQQGQAAPRYNAYQGNQASWQSNGQGYQGQANKGYGSGQGQAYGGGARGQYQQTQGNAGYAQAAGNNYAAAKQ